MTDEEHKRNSNSYDEKTAQSFYDSLPQEVQDDIARGLDELETDAGTDGEEVMKEMHDMIDAIARGTGQK